MVDGQRDPDTLIPSGVVACWPEYTRDLTEVTLAWIPLLSECDVVQHPCTLHIENELVDCVARVIHDFDIATLILQDLESMYCFESIKPVRDFECAFGAVDLVSCGPSTIQSSYSI